jgi:DNA-binding NarL/FixJ family response regulator
MIPANRRRPRLLIVEDNPAEGELICERLSTACSGAVRISRASNMASALRTCEKASFDCAVIDLLLPDASGAEIISAMRARCPDAAIVAYSGMDSDAWRTTALHAGAHYFVSKNSNDPHLLERSVLRALEQRLGGPPAAD